MISKWVACTRFLYRLGMKRGLGRATRYVAMMLPSLRMHPVRMKDGRTLYLDLREAMALSYVLTGDIWQESAETEFVRRYVPQSAVTLDIGANVGWYSTLLSDAVGVHGRVYAFEPNAKAAAMLLRTSRRYPQLTVIPLALSDESGDALLYMPDDGGMASLHELPNTVRTQPCRTITLDTAIREFEIPNVAFVKCDAEGAELQILNGAKELLNSPDGPTWLIEINPSAAARFGYNVESVVRIFEQCGYRGYRLHSVTGQLMSLPARITYRFNALFIPDRSSH